MEALIIQHQNFQNQQYQIQLQMQAHIDQLDQMLIKLTSDSTMDSSSIEWRLQRLENNMGEIINNLKGNNRTLIKQLELYL